MHKSTLKQLVAFFLACGPAAWAQTVPTINPGGIAEAAQYMPMAAPGSIATLFGQFLAGGTFQADTIPLPTELGSVQVEVNGVPAPLYFVSNGQINFQIPFETQTGTANVVVIRNGVEGPAEPIQVKDYVPAAFKNQNTGEAIVVENATGQLISAQNPAVAGQIVRVYMNGYGVLDHPPATGAASPSDPLARTAAVPRVTLGDQDVTVYYAGLTPGLVGLGQLDLGLPAELPGSLRKTLPLTIDFDGFVAPLEDLPVELPAPAAPDVGIEITNVTPQSVLPGGSFRVDYTLRNPTGYTGEATVSFFLRLDNTYTTLERFTAELSGVDLALSRELMIRDTMFPGSYELQGSVEIAGDGNSANDVFVVAEPFVIEAAGGDPHDIGVTITSVTPSTIEPGATLTFTYTLLNLTGYSGPVDVTFQLSTSSSGRVLMTEQVMLSGVEREIVREAPTPQDLPADTYRPIMRVAIENDTDPSNNTAVLFDAPIVVTAPATLTSNAAPGVPPPFGDLAEGNLSQWELEAYRGGLPVNPGVRLGGGSAAVAGGSFLTAVASAADRLVLRYPRAAALQVNWDLSQRRALELWVSLGGNQALRGGSPRVALRSAAGRRTLTLAEASDGGASLFRRFCVPLAGDGQWIAVDEGAFDIGRVTAFELDFELSRPGQAEVNVDGVQLTQ